MDPCEQSELVPYCLHYRLPKNIRRGRTDDKTRDWREKVKPSSNFGGSIFFKRFR